MSAAQFSKAPSSPPPSREKVRSAPRRLGLTILLALCLTGPLLAADWPQFLGPERNGVYAGPPLAAAWPKDSPSSLWKKAVGVGFAGPVVANGKVFLFHRKQGEERVTCFSLRDGAVLWERGYPATYKDDFGFDEGPRATPAVQGDKLVTYGADGMITAWRVEDGKILWQADAKTRFGSPKGFFGRSPSPLIHEGAVVIHAGGKSNGGLAALALEDGSVAWRTNSDEASYASPVIGRLDGKPRLLALTRKRLLIMDPSTGALAAEFPFEPSINASVSAATPLVSNGTIFLTASYGAGAAALRFADGRLSTIWRNDDALSSHYSTPVVKGDWIFGFDGRQEQGAELACISLGSGKERWRERGLGAGAIILAADQLVILTEKGELILAPASEEGFKPTARAQVLGFDTRAHPALADGLLIARDKQNLVCLDLSASGKKSPQ